MLTLLLKPAASSTTIVEATAASAGASTVSGVSGATAISALASSGVGSSTVAGSAIWASLSSATGSATPTGVGAYPYLGTAASSGTGSTTGIGAANFAASASGSGVAASTVTGSCIASSDASASGVGDPSASALSVATTTAESDGAAETAVRAVGDDHISTDAVAFGSSSAVADGGWITSTVAETGCHSIAATSVSAINVASGQAEASSSATSDSVIVLPGVSESTGQAQAQANTGITQASVASANGLSAHPWLILLEDGSVLDTESGENLGMNYEVETLDVDGAAYASTSGESASLADVLAEASAIQLVTGSASGAVYGRIVGRDGSVVMWLDPDLRVAHQSYDEATRSADQSSGHPSVISARYKQRDYASAAPKRYARSR